MVSTLPRRASPDRSPGPVTTEIPLFPLGLVLVPGGYLPLRIFERRYLDMVSDAAREGSGFGVCLVTRDAAGSEGAPGPAQHARTGTLARIRDFYTLDDGLLGITCEGFERYRIERTRVRDDGLVLGEVNWLEEPAPRSLPPEYALLASITENFMDKLGTNYPDYTPQRLQDAAWVGYRLTELLPLEAAEKQVLLEMNDPLQRLQSLLEALPRFQADPADE